MNTTGDILDYSPVLIKKALEGSESAFRELYEKLSGKMYGICLRYAGNAEDANDLFQDGFVKLYRNLTNFRNEGSFEGWARRIFVTTCLDHLKKKKQVFDEVSETTFVESRDINGFEKLALSDLMGIIQELPKGYRTIINLYIIEGYSHKEIAGIFGITESGSKSQLHKARLYLKKKYGLKSE